MIRWVNLMVVATAIATLACTSDDATTATDARAEACPADPGGYCNNEGPVFCPELLCVDSTHYRRAKTPAPCTTDPCCLQGCTGWFALGLEDAVETCPAGHHCASVGCPKQPCVTDDAGVDADAAEADVVD